MIGEVLTFDALARRIGRNRAFGTIWPTSYAYELYEYVLQLVTLLILWMAPVLSGFCITTGTDQYLNEGQSGSFAVIHLMHQYLSFKLLERVNRVCSNWIEFRRKCC